MNPAAKPTTNSTKCTVAPTAMWMLLPYILLSISTRAQAHPAHETNAEVIWNAASRTFEVALKIRGIDLEQALSIDGGRVDLENTVDIDERISNYLEDRFKIQAADGHAARFSFVGKEFDARTCWLFFEYALPETIPPTGCGITNRILFDTLPGQVNKIDLRIDVSRQLLLFSRRKPNAVIENSHMIHDHKTWQPPSLNSLPIQKQLPDVFTLTNGRRVSDIQQWETRRQEIKAMIQYFEYGHLPPRPDTTQGTLRQRTSYHDNLGTEERILLTIGSKAQLKMDIAIHLPSTESGIDKEFPVIISAVHKIADLACIKMFLKNGYAFVQYEREDLDPDEQNVVGPAQAAYPDHDWATLAVWAWGASRVVDYLESRDDIDTERIGITGHSRGGKAALLAGALDERFALVAPNGSGCGGAGCFRGTNPQISESLEKITDPERFGYWFHDRFRQFADREELLPFDQHFVKALVAPRALLCTEARGDLWANPEGTRRTNIAARDVYSFMDSKDKIGLCYRDGKHNQTLEDWRALLNFAQWHFFDQTPTDQTVFWQSP